MDRKPQNNPEIERLVLLAEAARSHLGSDAKRLKHQLDVPARLRHSLRHHPVRWLAGSLGSGLAASLLLRRKAPKPKKRRAISSSLIGLTLTAGRPLVKIWLANQVRHWLAGQSNQASDPRLATQPRPSSNPF